MRSLSMSERRKTTILQPAFFFVGLFLLASLFLGCTPTEHSNTAQQGDDDSSAANTAAEAKKEDAASGLCFNEYYPISDTVKRAYKVTGAEPGTYDLAQKEITDSGFAEDRSFSYGLVVTNNWICTDEGLRTAEFTNQGISKDVKFDMETLKSEGVTIPKTLEAGKEWTAKYDVKVKLNAGNIAVAADGDVTITNKVGAIDETVNVADKEYKAARIDSDIKIVVSMKGKTTEAATVKTSNWFVKGVGMVKQVTGGTLGKQTVEFVGEK